PSRDDVAWTLLGLGLFNSLQFAALGLGRAIGIDSTRYLDICAFNLIINFACVVLVADGVGKRLLVAAWPAVVAAGWAVDTASHVPQELTARRSLGLAQERSVRTFLTTGAFPADASDADLTIPYPNAAHLADVLSNPKVRQILPSIFQDATAQG